MKYTIRISGSEKRDQKFLANIQDLDEKTETYVEAKTLTDLFTSIQFSVLARERQKKESTWTPSREAQELTLPQEPQ